ncbi:MAG TPA: DUF86 domain-containing protein [Actinomycetota bacterium]|nr:DUF86 domain-containing protein [Actinomycetota bacterium]
MRRPEALAHLFDIERACTLLARFTADRTFEDYAGDDLLRSAVERQFEIIGEALRRALEAEPALTDLIADTGRIVAFRNRLIHGYASVSAEVVWGVLEANVATLHDEVRGLLAEGGAQPFGTPST